ncbi:hypothetical protein NMY22_g14312 [Coprinellus aureogranulatus]|nr:hypothetical protein NMY22_g14312 [Coprinellus aureogranulatus]
MRSLSLLHALVLLAATFHWAGASDVATSRCKCLYGQSCWPSQQSFDDLQSQLSQPLLRPSPAAFPCYSEPDSDACQDVRKNYREGLWRGELPGVMQHTNFNAYIFQNGTISRCPLDHTRGQTCDQGSVPPIGVDARIPEDIQAAVRFAKRYNLKLVIQNTGHDFLGRSAGRDSFMIWTHRMKNITIHDSFVPFGQSGTDGVEAVTLGAGVQWFEVYAAVHAQGKTIVGGVSTNGTVGAAGGWPLGGGHSALAPTFGFGVDNVLELKVVTADAKHLTVNARTNPRLFWALRGGGGGSLGVVTSLTYRIHPRVPNSGIYIVGNFTSPEIAQNITAEFIRLHPTLSDKQWGGYSGFATQGFQSFWIAPNVSPAEAQETIAPFTDLMATVMPGQFVNATLPFDSFLDWYNFTFLQATTQVGVGLEISSRLLSKDAALQRPEEIAKTLLSLPRGAAFNSVAGGAASKMNPDMAFNPSWRRAIAEVAISQPVDVENGAIETIRAARESLKEDTKILDTITTDSAAYYNEATLYEVDFRKSFWGPNYPKLKEIKEQYDPTSLFIVARGVGSEDWDTDLNCRA